MPIGLLLLLLLALLSMLLAAFRSCLSTPSPLRYRRKAIALTPETITDATPTRGRCKPAWARNEVLRLKALMGNAGVRSIATTFNRLHGERMTVGKTFVAQLIKKHQYEIACLTRDIRNAPAKPYRINAVWALDFTFHTDTQGNTHAALGVIDHGWRVLITLRRISRRNAWTVLGHLCLAIGQFGKPRIIRTDNEAVFKNRLLQRALKRFGIRRQFTQPHSPWQNGRIERLFGTLNPLLKKLAVANASALDMALCKFRLFYNHVRTHQNLDGHTPAEVWATGGHREALPPVRKTRLVSALGGLLVGYYLRR